MPVPANARILQAITKPIVEATKPAPKAELEWTQLDPSTLSPDLRKAYDAYRDALPMPTLFAKHLGAP